VDLAVRGLDAGLGELNDLVAALLGDIDDVYIISVQDFVVVLLEARSLWTLLAGKFQQKLSGELDVLMPKAWGGSRGQSKSRLAGFLIR